MKVRGKDLDPLGKLGSLGLTQLAGEGTSLVNSSDRQSDPNKDQDH